MSSRAEAGHLGLANIVQRQSRVTAPKWGKIVPERIAWSIHFLTVNPLVYKKFRELADEFHARNPKMRVSAELIINQIRWLTVTRTEGDPYAINSNCKSLLVRLYHLERPEVQIDLRKSWIDLLHVSEWESILSAWRSANGFQA
jgi:hypothetical protein